MEITDKAKKKKNPQYVWPIKRKKNTSATDGEPAKQATDCFKLLLLPPLPGRIKLATSRHYKTGEN